MLQPYTPWLLNENCFRCLQVLLWSLGDHVSTLADGTAGSFGGAETRVAARTVLKVSTRALLCIVFLPLLWLG